MKIKKKAVPSGIGSVDDIIAGASSTKLEEKIIDQDKKDGRGRPKGDVLKKTCSFRLPLDIIKALDTNNKGGNKSVFLEEIIREYFKRNKIII